MNVKVRILGIAIVVAGMAGVGSAHSALAAPVADCPTTEIALSADITSAGSGGTVAFRCASPTTIVITTTIVPPTDVTLDGSGSQPVTLDGAYGPQLISVPAGVTLTLDDLTLTRGNPSYPINEGGAISNLGTLYINNSTFTNNFARDGGALSNQGTATVSNSTFSNNDATSGVGGAISSLGALTITNSTIAGNTANGAGGGIYSDSGTVTIGGSIIANNGVSCPSFASSHRTIPCFIAMFSGISDNCAIPSSLVDTGYNLETGADCGFTATGDIQGTDPMLDSSGLQDNGGPTNTIALLPTSPAIDQIPPTSPLCAATDQRGVSRPQGPLCDIGAYELVKPSNLTVKLSVPPPYTQYVLSHISNNGSPLGVSTVSVPLQVPVTGSVALSADQVILATLGSDTFFFTSFQPMPPSPLTGDFSTTATYTSIESVLATNRITGFLGTAAVKGYTYAALTRSWSIAENAIRLPYVSKSSRLSAVHVFACNVSQAETGHKITLALGASLEIYAGQAYVALGGTFTTPTLC